MVSSYEWNDKLKGLKRQYPWLRNHHIASALDVTVARVNSWTKRNGRHMDHAFYELIELKLRGGALTKNS